MAREFRIDHDKLSDSQQVTKVMADEFKKQGLDTKKNIALDIIDDPTKRQRVVKVKNTRYFGSWKHRG
jgi:hypothetical protein